MKFRTTRKEILENYPIVIKAGYCSLQTLLSFDDPIAYTVRREGWSADVYQITERAVIVTGYAPFGNYSLKYETARNYEKTAETIRYDLSLGYEDMKKELRNLQITLIEEITKKEAC